MTNQIYPCLWFNGDAESAATLYCSIFKNARVNSVSDLVVEFEMAGQKFMGLNGGPMFKPNPSVSFLVICETHEELDLAWQKLSEGGSVLMPLDKYDWSERYGWCSDKFGVSWQLYLGKIEDVGQKFTASLLFSGEQFGKAEEAVHFYTSVFKNSGITGILKYKANEEEKEGTVKHAQFNINLYVLMAMDSSEPYASDFNEGVSFVVNCKDQAEIDYYWNKFTEKGTESMCGWLKDQYGVSWQIVPEILGKLMSDPEKAPRVVQAFLKMKKFEIDKLINA